MNMGAKRSFLGGVVQIYWQLLCLFCFLLLAVSYCEVETGRRSADGYKLFGQGESKPYSNVQASGGADLPDPPPMTLHFVTNAVQRNAVCADSSPAGYYLRNYTGITRWVIFLEGDPNVVDEQFLGSREGGPGRHAMSSTGWAPTSSGYLMVSPYSSENPTFYGFNHLLLRYCSGDFWMGDLSPMETNMSRDGQAMRGFRIVQEVLEDIEDLEKATDIIFAGNSAGAIGVLKHANWLYQLIRSPRFRVGSSTPPSLRILLDSPFMIEHGGMLDAARQSIQPILDNDTDCNLTVNGVPCCLLPYCMLGLIKKDTNMAVFLTASQYDGYILFRAKMHSKNSKSAQQVVASTHIQPLDYYLFMADMVGYKEAVQQTLLFDTIAKNPLISYFMPACLHHSHLPPTEDWFQRREGMGFREDINYSSWAIVSINGHTLRDAITRWFNVTDVQTKAVATVDTCLGALCNPTCLTTYDVTVTQKHVLRNPICKGFLFLVYAFLLAPIALELIMVGRWCKMLITQHKVLKVRAAERAGREVQRDVWREDNDASGSDEMGSRREGEILEDRPFSGVDRGAPMYREFGGDALEVSLEDQVYITFHQLSYWVQPPDGKKGAMKPKQILKRVSGAIKPGELTAIMGPSGCGKTTLLELLMGRRRSGFLGGSIMVDGVPFEDQREWMEANAAFVKQEDVGFAELTVRESLTYSAMMRLPRTMDDKQKLVRVEQVIEEVGLSDCADVIFGGESGPRLSGGQRRRLCIATELLTLPVVIMLDEPTSGLDATSALELTQLLLRLAHTGRTVGMIVHQPRREMFDMFDRLIIMLDGQIMFSGRANLAAEFFSNVLMEEREESCSMSSSSSLTLGSSSTSPLLMGSASSRHKRSNLPEKGSYIAPSAANPADLLIDLLKSDGRRLKRFATMKSFRHIRQRKLHVAASPKHEKAGTTTPPRFFLSPLILARVPGAQRLANIYSSGKNSWKSSWFTRLWALEARVFTRGVWGWQSIFIFTVAGVVGGVIWMSADRVAVLSIAIMAIIAMPPYVNAPYIGDLFFKELPVFRLEQAAGACDVFDFIAHHVVHNGFLWTIAGLVWITPMYRIPPIAFEMERYMVCLAILLIMVQLSARILMLASTVVKTFEAAILYNAIWQGLNLAFGGVFVPIAYIPSFFRWAIYLFPSYLCFSAVSNISFSGRVWDCKSASPLQCLSRTGDAWLRFLGFYNTSPCNHLVALFLYHWGLVFISFFLLAAPWKQKYPRKYTEEMDIAENRGSMGTITEGG